MLKKSVNAINLLVSGLFFIAVGIFSIVSGSTLMRYVIILLAAGIFIHAIIRFFLKIFNTSNKSELFVRTIIDLVFGSVLFFKVDFISASIIVIFGIYLLCHALIELISFVIYQVNRVRGRIRVFITFIILLVLSLCLILKPNQNMKYAAIIIGIYLIFYGITNITDFISEVMPQRVSNKIKMKIRFPLPIFLTAFIPQKLLNVINDSIKVEHDPSLFHSVKKNETPDLDVIIHLAQSGTASFGHVEIAFEGKIYSYGNYNRHSRKFYDGFGDGVICIADKDAYIEYQVMNRGRYLVSFGLKLNEIQKTKVKERIHTLITENTIPYYPDLQLYEMGLIEKKNFRDMSSELYKLASAEYRKFTSGKNKTFFIMKTNCAVVAESILRSIGSFVPENGILSPGTYYDYLNGEFQKKNTNVISRTIYTKENIKKLKKDKKKA